MNKKLPRKLKKELKKYGVDWRTCGTDFNKIRKRHKHISEIFFRDYSNSHEVVKEIIGLED